MRGLVNVTYTFSFFFPHFSIYYIHSPRSLDLLPFLSFKKNDAALQQFHIPLPSKISLIICEPSPVIFAL